MSKCTRCGHECHCGTDCEECVNDVCHDCNCLLYTSPSPRDVEESRMPSSA